MSGIKRNRPYPEPAPALQPAEALAYAQAFDSEPEPATEPVRHKVGDRLHGFDAVRVTPTGRITWKCTMCESTALLRPDAIDDWMRQHQARHTPTINWPFPIFPGTDGKPTSPIWAAA